MRINFDASWYVEYDDQSVNLCRIRKVKAWTGKGKKPVKSNVGTERVEVMGYYGTLLDAARNYVLKSTACEETTAEGVATAKSLAEALMAAIDRVEHAIVSCGLPKSVPSDIARTCAEIAKKNRDHANDITRQALSPTEIAVRKAEEAFKAVPVSNECVSQKAIRAQQAKRPAPASTPAKAPAPVSVESAPGSGVFEPWVTTAQGKRLATVAKSVGYAEPAPAPVKPATKPAAPAAQPTRRRFA
jgi:hypothetical protein